MGDMVGKVTCETCTFDIKSRQGLRSRSSDFRHGKVQDHFTTIISKTHTGLQDKSAGVIHKPDAERKEIRRHWFNDELT